MVKCNNPECGLDTNNPKYCSRSCSAKVSNLVAKRKRKDKFCKTCGVNISYEQDHYSIKRVFCDLCNPMFVDWNKVSIEELQGRYTYQKSARLRSLARQAYKSSDRLKACEICGYDKHYEVCHIKAIRDFPDSAMVGEVNDLTNLIALCPNHHWELDNDHLSISPLSPKQLKG